MANGFHAGCGGEVAVERQAGQVTWTCQRCERRLIDPMELAPRGTGFVADAMTKRLERYRLRGLHQGRGDRSAVERHGPAVCGGDASLRPELRPVKTFWLAALVCLTAYGSYYVTAQYLRVAFHCTVIAGEEICGWPE